MAQLSDLRQLRNNSNVRKMLDLLAYTEGTQRNGYHTAFGGGQLAHLRDHPRYLKAFRQTNGKINYTSAAGRYQFVRKTWDSLARKYGFRDFGAENQDLGAIALMVSRGAMPHIIKGNWGQAIAKLGAEWASLPTSPYPQPTKSWKKVNDFLGGKIAIPQSNRQQDKPSQRQQWNEPQWKSNFDAFAQRFQRPKNNVQHRQIVQQQPAWQEPQWQSNFDAFAKQFSPTQ